jgi:hypothetical protein
MKGNKPHRIFHYNKNMRIQHLVIFQIALVLTTACNIQASSLIEPEVIITQEAGGPENQISLQSQTVEPEILITQVTNDLRNYTMLPTEITSQDCLNDKINSIGQSIAEDYENASYEQVMIWFCDGAEFEDILVALETEEQTGTPAFEMLRMLSDGFSWEEIWLLIGLTE